MVGELAGVLHRVGIASQEIRIKRDDHFGLVQVIDHRTVGSTDGIERLAHIPTVDRLVLDDGRFWVLLENFLQHFPEAWTSRRLDQDRQTLASSQSAGTS